MVIRTINTNTINFLVPRKAEVDQWRVLVTEKEGIIPILQIRPSMNGPASAIHRHPGQPLSQISLEFFSGYFGLALALQPTQHAAAHYPAAQATTIIATRISTALIGQFNLLFCISRQAVPNFSSQDCLSLIYFLQKQ